MSEATATPGGSTGKPAGRKRRSLERPPTQVRTKGVLRIAPQVGGDYTALQPATADVTLNVTYTGPNSSESRFWGFHDGAAEIEWLPAPKAASRSSVIWTWSSAALPAFSR